MEIITEQGEHFDVPADYSFDFEFINPMLSEHDNNGSGFYT